MAHGHHVLQAEVVSTLIVLIPSVGYAMGEVKGEVKTYSSVADQQQQNSGIKIDCIKRQKGH